ncbi:MAG: hypothetical protein ABI222_13420 [Opitutaceae bacterium]
MSQSEEPNSMQKFTTPGSLVVDLVLVILFFAYMFTVLRQHVPSTDPKMTAIWGALGSACMTGVFWLALQMFRVVFRAYREAQRNK